MLICFSGKHFVKIDFQVFLYLAVLEGKPKLVIENTSKNIIFLKTSTIKEPKWRVVLGFIVGLMVELMMS